MARLVYRLVTLLFWLMLVGGVLGSVVIIGFGGRLGVQAEVPSTAEGAQIECPDDCHVSSSGGQPVTVWFDEAGVSIRGVVASAFSVPVIATLAVLWQLRALLRSVRERDPFNARNVRRLRILAMIFLVGPPLVEALRSAITAGLIANVRTAYTRPDLLHIDAMIASLSLFVLAEVFAYGARLREDVEATV